MANEAGMRDLNLQSMKKSISHTTRSSLLVLASIALFSGLIIFQSSDLMMMGIVEKTETKQTPASINQTVSMNQTVSINQSALTTEIFQRVELTREEQRGSWMGNEWAPPPAWKSYSASELRNFYRDTSILWIGDSTGWRAATTLYGILQSNASSSDVSTGAIRLGEVSSHSDKRSIITSCKSRWKKQSPHPDICRVIMPGGGRGGNFLFKGETCLTGLELFVRDELSGTSNITADVDIIIVSLGIWEAEKPGDCKETDATNPRSMLQRQNDTISLLEKLQSPRRSIVWRTSGHTETGKKEDFVVEMNGKAMDQIEEFALREVSRTPKSTSNLTYVDWGGAVHPRSFGGNRISGEDKKSKSKFKPHYGLAAQLVLVQMMTNHLASRLPGVQLQTSA
jgi:hypothetical protein